MMAMESFLLLFSLLSLICNGYIIHTDYEYQYYNKTIICPDGEPCEIKCVYDYGCQFAKIECPPNFNCTIQFSKQYSGANTRIHAERTTNLAISTTGFRSALNSVINGPKKSIDMLCDDRYSCYGVIIYASDTDMSLYCNDYQSCQELKLFAENVTKIDISCNGQYGCNYMKLFADNVIKIDISCIGQYGCAYMKLYQQSPHPMSHLNMNCSGGYGCQYSTIKSNSNRLQIDCAFAAVSSSSACRYAKIYHNPEVNESKSTIHCGIGGCTQMSIYSIEGTFDIMIESRVSQTNLKMYCGINYYHSCDLQSTANSNYMLCDNTDFCMNYQFNPDTDFNIVIPQSYSKYNDTIICDSNVKDCSIYCISKYSCSYSDIICPQNSENASCTIYCGNYGCSHSVISAYNISTLTLHSKSDYAFEYVTLQISYLKDIIIKCNNAFSCQHMKLNSINTNEIDLSCRGRYSCAYSDIMYSSDGDYYTGYQYLSNVDVDCYGDYSCRQTTINSNAGYLNVACNSDSSGTGGCYDSSIYCPSTALMDTTDINLYSDILCGKGDSCINLDIYSINGWNNVKVSSINDQHPSSATMHCDATFSQSCSMQGHVNSQEWFCDDEEICSDYRLDLNAQIIIMTKNYEYYNKTIKCNLNQDCYIYCRKTSSCQYSTIHCGNQNCELYCHGSRSCQYSQIMALDANILSIHSSGGDGASYAKIYAPNNKLSIECTTSSSTCKYQTIYATNTNYIELDCQSSYSCQYQTIYAENTNSLYQNCGGSYSCRNSALFQYLPLKTADGVQIDCYGSYSCYQYTARSSITFNILCDTDNSCKEFNAFIPKDMSFNLECINDVSCIYFDIYSLNGFVHTNINITSYDDSYVNTAKFYCGNRYTKYCQLNALANSDQWICTDNSNYCYDYQQRETDTDYILVKYGFQYAEDYIVCNTNKSNCDISCKSQYSCWNSKIICPLSDNGNCSVYCSQSSACTNLDIYSVNGFSSVTLDCNGNNQYCSGITLFCTQFFNETCIVDNNGNCNGFCANYTSINSVMNTLLDIILPDSKYHPNDSYIVTDYDYEYYNNSILCVGDVNSECHINCKNNYACQFSTIVFIGNNLDCYVSCSSQYSCGTATINAANCKSLTVNSAGSYGSNSLKLYVNTVETLNLYCSSTYACRYLKIYKDADPLSLSQLQIDVACNGRYACDNQYYSINSAQSINIRCLTDYSCRNSQYYLYSVLSSSWYCEGTSSCSSSMFTADSNNVLIQCNAQYACYFARMFIPQNSIVNCSHSGGCGSVSIYSITGSNAINIVSTVNNSMAISNKLYCTQSYTQFCILQNDETTRWNCDSNNACYEYLIDEQVFKTQYTYEFYNNDIYCDANKDCHIACKHQDGCQYSNIHCPNNYTCNIFCGYSGCRYATINAGDSANLNLICYDDYGCANSII
eukprot:341372_1